MADMHYYVALCEFLSLIFTLEQIDFLTLTLT